MKIYRRGLGELTVLGLTVVFMSQRVTALANQQQLLKLATRVAAVRSSTSYSDYCVWLSDRKVISVDYPENWHGPPVVTLHDFTTHKVRSVSFAH